MNKKFNIIIIFKLFILNLYLKFKILDPKSQTLNPQKITILDQLTLKLYVFNFLTNIIFVIFMIVFNTIQLYFSSKNVLLEGYLL